MKVGRETKNYQLKNTFSFMIIPYLLDVINDHKAPMNLIDNSNGKIIDYKFGEWKIQLTMQVNFISSKHSEEIRTMSTKSDNIEIIMGSETDGIIKGPFKSFLLRYQEGLEEKMRVSEFVF